MGGETDTTGSQTTRSRQRAHELGDGGKIVGDGTTMTKEEYFHFAAGIKPLHLYDTLTCFGSPAGTTALHLDGVRCTVAESR